MTAITLAHPGQRNGLRTSTARGTSARYSSPETFLTKAEARLYVLDPKVLSARSGNAARPIATADVLRSNNRRLVLEQLLVMEAMTRDSKSFWVVNARQ